MLYYKYFYILKHERGKAKLKKNKKLVLYSLALFM